jgi:hypothetical protein
MLYTIINVWLLLLMLLLMFVFIYMYISESGIFFNFGRGLHIEDSFSLSQDVDGFTSC